MMDITWEYINGRVARSPHADEIIPFLKHIRDTEIKPTSALNNVKAIFKLETVLDGVKLRDTKPEHIEKLRGIIKAKGTRRIHFIALRRYFRFIGRDDLIPHLKTLDRRAIKDGSKLDLDTVPTREDIITLFQSCNHQRDRTIIALLADTGLRAHELLALRIGDLDMDAPVPKVQVSAETKTGQRVVPIIPYHNAPAFSPPEIAAWLNQHPQKDNPKAPLFPTYGYGSHGGALKYEGLYRIFNAIYKRSGTGKPGRPHKLRDFCVMERAVQLTDAELEAFMGWTEGSSMRKRYTTAAGVRARLLERANQIAGVEPDNEANRKARKCVKCHESLPTSANFCPRCATKQPTGEERVDVEALMDEKRRAAEMLNEIQGNPDLLLEMLTQLKK